MGILNNGNQSKIREAINKFKLNRKITDIQRNFMKRLLMSKAGLVLIAFRKWTELPELTDKGLIERGAKFESGLKRFVERTLKRSLDAFKNEFEIGQATKKRAVIQLINVTMSGQKKFYQRWLNITDKSKLLNECKIIGNVFNTINLLIKSVTDNAFADNKSNKIKIDAINTIFFNMSLGLGDSLKRWREVNQIEKMREKMNNKQR